MKYVPSLPPPIITGGGDNMMVNGPAATKAVKPVRSRTLQPLVAMPRNQREEAGRELEERRHDPQTQGERRTYCRRALHLPVLMELRTWRERRHRNQRAMDMIEHIDIEA